MTLVEGLQYIFKGNSEPLSQENCFSVNKRVFYRNSGVVSTGYVLEWLPVCGVKQTLTHANRRATRVIFVSEFKK